MNTTNPNAAATSSFATETDIYVTTDGRIIIADLPAELVARLASLGQVEPCEIGGLGDLQFPETEQPLGASIE